MSIKLHIPKDCDNAPKRKVIRDFIVDLYKQDFSKIGQVVEDDFEFRIIPNKTIKNDQELKIYLNKNKNVIELTLEEVLSHGKYGACNGSYKTENKLIHFAYFFEFKSAGKNTIKIISEYKIT